MNEEKQLRLAAFLQELAQAEMAIDDIKHKLSQVRNFNSKALFTKIARTDSHLTIRKLQLYIQQVMPITQRQLYELFCRFDWVRTGRISQKDFCQELQPYKRKRLVETSLGKPSGVSIGAEKVFFELVREYLQRWRIHEICREELSRMIPYQAFDTIAAQRRGYIGFEELQLFMERNEVAASKKELKFMMWALKRRHYVFVTLEVFCENLWPVEFSYYSAFEAELRGLQQNDYQLLNRQSETIRKKSQKEQYKLIRAQMKHQHRVQAKLAEGEEHVKRTEDMLLSRKLNKTAASRISTVQAEKLQQSNLELDLMERQLRRRQQHQQPKQVTYETQRLETPYFERQASYGPPKEYAVPNYTLEASRREAERYRQQNRQEYILTEIQQQALLRRTQIDLTNRLLERNLYNFRLPHHYTELAKTYLDRSVPVVPQADVSELHLANSKLGKRSASHGKTSPYDCIPITQTANSPSQENIPLAPRSLSYSFGEEHLRIYRQAPSKPPRNRP